MAVTSGRVTTNQVSRTTFYVKWNQTSQSIANNETTISWEAGINNGNYDRYYSNAVKIYSVYINGVLVSNGGTWSNINPSASDIGLLSGTLTIPHNSDGSKTFSVSISAWTYSSSNYSGSDSFQLTNIPRQATFIDATNFNDEGNPTITYNNSAGNNATKLQAYIESMDSSTTYVAARDIPKTGNSYTFELTALERETLTNASPNSNTLSLRFVIYTQIGGNDYYTGIERTMSIINANPTLDSKSYQDINPDTLTITSDNQVIIQNLSSLEITLGNMYALKGASLTSVSININGNVITESLSGYIVAGKVINYNQVDVSSNEDAIITLKDTRNNTTSYTLPITIWEYYNPSAIINCSRDSNYYTQSTINVDADYAYLDGHNTIAIQFRNRKNGEQNWGNWISLSDSTDYTFNADNQYAWDIQVKVTDILNASHTYTIAKALDVGIPIVFYDTDRRSVGINCLPTHNDSLEIRGKQIIDFIYPIDSIYMSVNSTNPQLLFGGTWEQIKDTFLLSAGDTYTAGTTGGEAAHTLTADEIAPHYHTGTTDGGGGHSHTMPSTYTAYLNGSGGTFTGGSGDPYGANTGYENNHTHTFTTNSTGGGQAHNNMPPYLVVYVWKRIA